LKALVDLLRKQLPTRVVPSWRYNSKPVMLDPALTGQARFAVQIDSGVGSISSRLTVSLSVRAGAGDTTLITTDLPEGISAGAFINIAQEEQNVVTNIELVTQNDGTQVWYWTLTNVLLGSYAVGDAVTFAAFPVTLTHDVNVGDTSLVVESQYFIVPGDTLFQLTLPAEIYVSSPISNIKGANSLTQVDISTKRWSISVDTLLFQAFAGSILYVSAVVAYSSARVPLSEFSGPYLADMMGGKTLGTGSDNLLLTYNFFSGLTYTTTVARNAVVFSLPIRISDVALWSIETGNIKPLTQDLASFELDTSGNLAVAVELPFAVPLVVDWVLNKSIGSFALLADGVVVLNSGSIIWSGTAQRLELRISGTPGDTWTISTNQVRVGYRSAQYSYVAQVKAGETWSGTCAMLKPLLKQLSGSFANDFTGDYISVNDGGIIF